MTKRQKAKLIKELKHLHENNIIPQEHLIKMIKVVTIAIVSPKDHTTYHDLLEAIGLPYKDKLLEGWDALVQEAAKHNPIDDLVCNV
jgi:hypothetical protein